MGRKQDNTMNQNDWNGGKGRDWVKSDGTHHIRVRKVQGARGVLWWVYIDGSRYTPTGKYDNTVSFSSAKQAKQFVDNTMNQTERDRAMLHPNFMNKANRDAYLREIKAEDKTRKYRKTSIRNQCLHPQYVKDYEKETGVKLAAEDKGFGNEIYKTSFAVLYSVADIDERD